MTRPTVCLVMIVKNEAHILSRLAESLREQIDRYVIVDTGSTDNTVKAAVDSFVDIPGTVKSVEWTGYSDARNVALDLAEESGADWALTMDADETLHGSVREAVSVFSSSVGIEAKQSYAGLEWWQTRLMRLDAGWKWYGRCHEYPAPNSQSPLARSIHFRIEHHADGGNRATKFDREIALLKLDWGDQNDPARSSFYLARSYDDVERWLEAVHWYRRRLELGGWDEELSYSRWRLGVCLLRSGYVDEGCGVLWKAWGADPRRAEPLASLVEHYRVTSQFNLAQVALDLATRIRCPSGALFVHTDVYDWRLDYERSIVSWYLGDHREGREATGRLLQRSDLPPEIMASVERNASFYHAVPAAA